MLRRINKPIPSAFPAACLALVGWLVGSMGITFRRSGYLRRVGLGKRTIKFGEAAAIWNRSGEHRQVIGPALVYLYSSTIEFLDQFSAKAHEYLFVTYVGGREEVVRGPVSMFRNPVLHQSIEVRSSIFLETRNDVVVVSSRKYAGASSSSSATIPMDPPATTSMDPPAATPKVPRTTTGNKKEDVADVEVVRGPLHYFPQVGDIVRKFTWTSLPPFEVLSTRSQRVFLSNGKTDGIVVHCLEECISRGEQNAELKSAFNQGEQSSSAAHTVKVTVVAEAMVRIDELPKFLNGAGDFYGELASYATRDIEAIVTKGISSLYSTHDDEGEEGANSNLGKYPSLMEYCERIGVVLENLRIARVDLDDAYKAKIEDKMKKQHEMEQKFLEEEQRQRVADLELSAARRREDEVAKHEQAKLKARIEEETSLRDARDEATIKYLISLKENGVDLNDYFKSVAKALSAGGGVEGPFESVAKSMMAD